MNKQIEAAISQYSGKDSFTKIAPTQAMLAEAQQKLDAVKEIERSFSKRRLSTVKKASQPTFLLWRTATNGCIALMRTQAKSCPGISMTT